ncbi:hypothetical protein MPSEU_000125900 [Mayamaea pseudoterrestris]|nr:hypothetical protein MPSEU_000124600 [Mayamaea pseudoterrestris]GKY91538.1 hypothetical protein MPSEU_000125900 [Mayamaea pseudoterrestris]
MDIFNADEHEAASAFAALAYKRNRDSPVELAGDEAYSKRPKPTSHDFFDSLPLPPAAEPQHDPNPTEETELKPYPFFYYRDYSRVKDNDPLIPLTPPGRVANFVAKMHCILSMPELVDVVAWMPHGRSWRVLKPREFEVRVIPRFFEHSKFSSFIRQANGWGFRRITQGRDRNSYYHPLFLRGIPHLCKEMKRPGVSEKQAADPEQEPDFYKISEMYPTPEKPVEDDSVLLHFTLQHGPKARMPIYSGSYQNAVKPTLSTKPVASSGLTPRDHDALNAFHQSLGAAESQLRNFNYGASAGLNLDCFEPIPIPALVNKNMMAMNSINNNNHGGSGLHFQVNSKVSALAAANQLAFGVHRSQQQPPSPPQQPPSPPQQPPNLMQQPPNLMQQPGAAHFAAGFAAAQALSQQQLRTIMLQSQRNEQRQGLSKEWVFP